MGRALVAIRLQLSNVRHRVERYEDDPRVCWTLCGIRTARPNAQGRVGITPDPQPPSDCPVCYTGRHGTRREPGAKGQ